MSNVQFSCDFYQDKVKLLQKQFLKRMYAQAINNPKRHFYYFLKTVTEMVLGTSSTYLQ